MMKYHIISIIFVFITIILSLSHRITAAPTFILSIDDANNGLLGGITSNSMAIIAAMHIDSTSFPTTSVDFYAEVTYIPYALPFSFDGDELETRGYNQIECYVENDSGYGTIQASGGTVELTTLSNHIFGVRVLYDVASSSTVNEIYGIYCIINAPVPVTITMKASSNIQPSPITYHSLGSSALRPSPIELSAQFDTTSQIRITIPRSQLPLLHFLAPTGSIILYLFVDTELYTAAGDRSTTLMPATQPTDLISSSGQVIGILNPIPSYAFTGLVYSFVILDTNIPEDDDVHFFLSMKSPPSEPIAYLKLRFTSPLQQTPFEWEFIQYYLYPVFLFEHQTEVSALESLGIDNNYAITIRLKGITDGEYKLRPLYTLTTYGAFFLDEDCTTPDSFVTITIQPDQTEMIQSIGFQVNSGTLMSTVELTCTIYYNIAFNSMSTKSYPHTPSLAWTLIPIIPGDSLLILPNLRLGFSSFTPPYSIRHLITVQPPSISTSSNYAYQQLTDSTMTETIGIEFNGYTQAIELHIYAPIGTTFLSSSAPATGQLMSPKSGSIVDYLISSTIDSTVLTITTTGDSYLINEGYIIPIIRTAVDNGRTNGNDIYFISRGDGSSVKNIVSFDFRLTVYNLPARNTPIIPNYQDWDALTDYDAYQYQSAFNLIPMLSLSPITIVSRFDGRFRLSLLPFNLRTPTDNTNDVNSIWNDIDYYNNLPFNIKERYSARITFPSLFDVTLTNVDITGFTSSQSTSNVIDFKQIAPVQARPYQRSPGYSFFATTIMDISLFTTSPTLLNQQIEVSLIGSNYLLSDTITTSFYLSNAGTDHTFFDLQTLDYTNDVNGIYTSLAMDDAETFQTLQSSSSTSTLRYIKPGTKFTSLIKSNFLPSTTKPTTIELLYYPQFNSTSYDTTPILLKTYSFPIGDIISYTEFVLPTQLKIEKGFFRITYQGQADSYVIAPTHQFFILPSCYQLKSNVLQQQINERTSWESICLNGGICQSNGTCKCPTGSEGTKCELVIDGYDPKIIKCPQCISTNTLDCPLSTDMTNQCQCTSEWTGTTCAQPKSCTTQTTQLCISDKNGYVAITDDLTSCNTKCTCYNNWIGDKCNRCNLQCFNNGIVWIGCDKCGCPAGFSGDKCQCFASNTKDSGVGLNGYNLILQSYQIALDSNGNNVDDIDEYLQSLYTTLYNDIKQTFATELGLSFNSIELQIKSNINIQNGVDDEDNIIYTNSTNFALKFQYGCNEYNPTFTPGSLKQIWNDNILKLPGWDVITKNFIFGIDDEPTVTPDELVETPSTLPPPEQRLQEINGIIIHTISFVNIIIILLISIF